MTYALMFTLVTSNFVSTGLMLLYEWVNQYWLLLVVDVKRRKFSVFDSLVRKGTGAQAAMIDSVVSTFTSLSHFAAS